MRKRIISLICVFLLTVSSFSQTVIAHEDGVSDNTQMIETLQALNLLTEEKKITHDAFVYSLAGFLYEDIESMGSAADIALRTGMIDTLDEYKAEEVITLDEALVYAVVTLGYKSKAKLYGDNGYVKLASELGLLSGVLAGGSDILLLDDAARILYNMMDVPPMVAYYKNENEMGWGIETEETILSLNRDIYQISGMVTANEKTSVYRSEGTSRGYIKIDDREYSVSEKCNVDFLGMNVIVYLQKSSDGEETVIHIREKENKNETLTIASDDIESVAGDFSVIEYSDGSAKLRTAKLSLLPKIIYNGVYYDGYTVDDLSPDVGSLTLVDNNGDGKYEIVFVTSYQTMVVESLNSIDNIIYNRYKFTESIPSLTLDAEETDYCIYGIDGNKIEFSDLKTWDILSVAKSKDNTIINLYVSGNDKVSEKLTGIDYKEMELDIGGQNYKMTEEFLGYVNDSGKSLEVGEQYVFYIDTFGNVVYMESYMTTEYNLFYRMYEEDEKYYVVYMDTSNTWKTAPLAKKVKSGDTRYEASALYAILKDIDPQVVRLKENSKGEINKLETATQMADYDENNFTKTPESTYTYRLNPNCFNMTLYIEDDAKLFVFPENKKSRDDYYVRNASGFFTSDRNYTLVAYDKDEYGFSPVFTITDTAATQAERANKGMFIVTSIFEKDIDGDAVPVIKGNFGTYRNITLVGSNSDIYKNVSVGDVVNVGLNANGRVNYIKKVMSLNSFASVDPGNYYQANAIIAGSIESINLEKKRIKINCGTPVTLKLTPDFSIQLYTKNKGRCEIKTASELTAGDNIVCRVSHGNVAEVICVRER